MSVLEEKLYIICVQYNTESNIYVHRAYFVLKKMFARSICKLLNLKPSASLNHSPVYVAYIFIVLK